MKVRIRALVAAAIVAAWAPVAQAESAAKVVLDEQAVVEMALASHPTIQAARATAEAARSAATGAQLSRLPELTLSARYARLSSMPAKYRQFGGIEFPQYLNIYGARAEVSVSLTDTFLGLAATARAAGKRAEAAEIELIASKASIVYEARGAYFTYVARAYGVANAEDLVRVAARQVEEQRNKEKLGTVARNDVLPFETALDAAQMALSAAKGDLGAAEASLRAYAPALAGHEIALPPIEDFLHASSAPEASVDSAPQLRVLRVEQEASESAASAASLGRLPKLLAYGLLDASAPSPRVLVLSRLELVPTWEVGVRLEWSLSQVTTGTTRTSQARAEAEALRGRVEAARRTLTAEREGAMAQLEAANDRLRLAEGRVTRTQALVQAKRGELDAGTALPLTVVVAESDAFQAKNAQAGAAIDAAITRARIDFIDGQVELRATRKP